VRVNNSATIRFPKTLLPATNPARIEISQPSVARNELRWVYCLLVGYPEATVLVGKLKVIIFEKAVDEDDEFSHTGGHGDQGLLSCGEQACVKLF